jgi:hypothetical protein
MRSLFLPVIFENLHDEAVGLSAALRSGEIDSASALQLGDAFRRRGIAAFFLVGDPSLLLQDLQRSGQAYRRFLVDHPGGERVISREQPFLDAIAATDDDCASEIAADWDRIPPSELELEGDHFYFQFLRALSMPQPSRDLLIAAFGRLEAAGATASEARIGLCRGLLDGDGDAFDASLSLLLEERDDHFTSLASKAAAPESVLVTDGNFSVEGLALVRLAEQRELRIAPNHLHVPSLARLPSRVEMGQDTWSA